MPRRAGHEPSSDFSHSGLDAKAERDWLLQRSMPDISWVIRVALFTNLGYTPGWPALYNANARGSHARSFSTRVALIDHIPGSRAHRVDQYGTGHHCHTMFGRPGSNVSTID